MPLLTEEIRSAITNKGLVVITTALSKAAEPGSNAEGSGEVDYQFKRNQLTVAGDTVTLTRVANDASADTFNCVNIITNSGKACLGDVSIPGYVYTDSFSGCVFYLYQKGPTLVTGVHAHQGLETVSQAISGGALKGMVINKEVRQEFSPQSYMVQKGRRMLCRHETRQVMNDTEKGQMCFLAFLSCVELDKATTFLYCYKPSAEGNKIVRVIDTYVDNF